MLLKLGSPRSMVVAMLQNPMDKYNWNLRCSTSLIRKEIPIKTTKILVFIFEGGEYKKKVDNV